MRFKYRQLADDKPPGIDMTPFIDIVFNLLLFFLLSSSYVQHSSLELKLPTAATAETLDGDPIVVELTKDDRIYVKNEEMTFEDLRAKLTAIYVEGSKDRPLLLRADAYAYHGRIVSILDLSRELGVTSLNVETLPGSEKSPRGEK